MPVDLKRLAVAVAFATVLGAAFPAAERSPFGLAAQAQTRDRAQLSRIRIPVNKSQTIRLDYPFSDVLIGSSDIADVVPLSDQTLYVLGKKAGTTNISILDVNKRVVGIVDVEVGLDAGNVAANVEAGVGDSGLRVRGAGNQIVLEGTAPDAPTVDKAVEIARALSPGGVINATRIASPQQVMLKVRFIEVERSAARDLGFRFDRFARNQISGNPPFTSGRGSSIQTAPGSGTFTDALRSGNESFGDILLGFGQRFAGLDLLISALETRGVARRLAEPNLMAVSGESAEFLAGGEFPVTIRGRGDEPDTVVYKPFGVRLDFTATVLSNGLINLKVRPEVSDIGQIIGESPILNVRRATSTIELRDGQSFALAGLIQSRSDRNVDQLPWLGTIPVLGTLFRSASFQQNETELVVIVTPHLVRPAKPGDRLATPLDSTMAANDLDLFLSGKLEIEKKGDPGLTPLQVYITEQGKLIGAYGHILVARDPLPPDSTTLKPVIVAAPVKVKNAGAAPSPAVSARN